MGWIKRDNTSGNNAGSTKSPKTDPKKGGKK